MIKKLQHQNANLDVTAEQLILEKEQLENSHNNLCSNIEQFQKEHERLQTDLSQLNEKYSQEKHTLLSKIASLQIELENCQQLEKKIQAEKEKLLTDNTAFQTEFAQILLENKKLKNEFDFLKQVHKNNIEKTSQVSEKYHELEVLFELQKEEKSKLESNQSYLKQEIKKTEVK